MAVEPDRRLGCAIMIAYFLIGAVMGGLWVKPWLKAQWAQIQTEQKARTDFAVKCAKLRGEVHQAKGLGTVCMLPDGTIRGRL